MARAYDFPDGLSGGPLATSIQSPVLLVNNINCNAAEEYYEDMTLKKAAVMGGETLISNDIVEGLVNLY